MQTKHIEQYSFHEFLVSFQEAVLEGYRVDIETNEHFPQKYGDYLSAVLVRAQPEVSEIPVIAPNPLEAQTNGTTSEDLPVTTEVAPTKRTRKASA